MPHTTWSTNSRCVKLNCGKAVRRHQRYTWGPTRVVLAAAPLSPLPPSLCPTLFPFFPFLSFPSLPSLPSLTFPALPIPSFPSLPFHIRPAFPLPPVFSLSMRSEKMAPCEGLQRSACSGGGGADVSLTWCVFVQVPRQMQPIMGTMSLWTSLPRPPPFCKAPKNLPHQLRRHTTESKSAILT